MKIHFFYLAYSVLAFIVVGCKKNNDPFAEINFGTDNRLNIAKKMISDKTFKINDASNIITDTDTLYNIIVKGDTVSFHAALNPGLYDLGPSLKQLKLVLTGEDDLLNAYLENQNDFNKIREEYSIKIHNIIKLYSSWYGIPDSLSLPKNNSYLYKYDNDKLFKWSLPKYELTINPKKASITYKQHNYIKEQEKIIDSIKSNAKIENLIVIENDKIACNWNKLSNDKYQFTIDNVNANRIDPYDPRSITSLKLTFKIFDEFKKELYSADNIILQLKAPLKPKKDNFTPLDYYFNQENFMTTYYTFSNHKLDEIRRYATHYKIIPKIEITAVAFDDGNIITQNQ